MRITRHVLDRFRQRAGITDVEEARSRLIALWEAAATVRAQGGDLLHLSEGWVMVERNHALVTVYRPTPSQLRLFSTFRDVTHRTNPYFQ